MIPIPLSDDVKRQLGGKIGSAIDTVGGFFGDPFKDGGWSESLQSWGGQTNNQPFQLVRPAYASETTPTTTNQQSWPQSFPQSTAPPSGSVLGANTGSGGTQPPQPVQPDQPDQNTGLPQPNADADMRAINDIFSEVYSYLDKASGNLRGNQASVLQDVASQIADRQAQLTQSRSQVDRQLGEAEVGAQQRRQDVDASSVRLFNELMQGGQQRFGGASSAGQAYTELANVEQQRRAQTTATQFNTAMREIESERVRVEEQYQMGQKQLLSEKQRAEGEVKRDFDAKMLEIDRMRADAAQNKGAMKLEALQNLRNQVFQINSQERQFQQQLEAMRQSSLMELQTYQQKLAQSGQAGAQSSSMFIDQSNANPQTGLGISGGSNVPGQQMTGRIDDEMSQAMGYRAPQDDRWALTPGLSNMMLAGQGQQMRY
jgi:hypothetical protein